MYIILNLDDKWLPVVGDKLYKLSKSEAQTWMCMRQLLFNQTAMQQYEITDFRQRELAKVSQQLKEIHRVNFYYRYSLVSRDFK